MKGLLETIRVSGEGSPYTNAEEFAIMVQNQYEKNGYVCGAGMFSSTDLFSIELEALGGGTVKACYLSIRDIDGNGFQELINKPAEDIKPWEVAALSMVYDDCVDENGKVDISKLQELVNRCYVIEEHTEWSANYGKTVTNVTAAPVMSLLSGYRTEKSAQMSMFYGNLDTKNHYGISLPDVKADCYITDVVFSIDTYCHEWTDTNLAGCPSDELKEAHRNPIALSRDKKGKKITIDFKGSKDIVTIYEYTLNLHEEEYESDIGTAYADMVANPKNELYADTAKFAVDYSVGSIPGVGNVYSAVSGAYGIGQNYNENLEKNEEILKRIKGKELQMVAYTTGCSGSIVQCGDRYDVRNLGIDTGYVIRQTALYNEAVDRGVQKGEKISGYMEVQAEFDDYMSGKRTLEECRAINALFGFEHAEKCYGDYENTEMGITYDYEEYTHYIREELERDKGNEYNGLMQCTNNEVEVASETAAKKWCDEMEGK